MVTDNSDFLNIFTIFFSVFLLRKKIDPNGECLTPKVVYRADVANETNNHHTFYFGLTETTFKKCFNNRNEMSTILNISITQN